MSLALQGIVGEKEDNLQPADCMQKHILINKYYLKIELLLNYGQKPHTSPGN